MSACGPFNPPAVWMARVTMPSSPPFEASRYYDPVDLRRWSAAHSEYHRRQKRRSRR